jgi:glycosyltransferase involved in cell wall biosynthesis
MSSLAAPKDQKIDVVMPLRNGAGTLRMCLDALYRAIPVCHLIVVDAYSTDGSLEVLRKYPRTQLIQGPWNLGKAREVGISRVHTDWFAFVDCDVILFPSWFQKALTYMSPGVGGVECMGAKNGRHQRIVERLGRLTGWYESDRPFTGNTLIRTESVRGIKLPDISLYEDFLIARQVKENGYLWIRSKERLGRHAPRYSIRPETHILSGIYAYQLRTIRQPMIWLPIILVAKLAYSFIECTRYPSRALQTAIALCQSHVYYTIGLLKARFGRQPSAS